MDRDGQAVAQSSFSISPSWARFPHDTWEEGDVALTNDPWKAGLHLPDVTVVTPIFYNEKLVGFTGSTAHWAGIDGTGFTSDTKELFQED